MADVRVSRALADAITRAFGPERSADGQPSEWDFWSGPLTAALLAFRDVESLPYDLHPDVRTLHVADPVYGPVVFVGVLVDPDTVELAAYALDPGYWDVVGDDPVD